MLKVTEPAVLPDVKAERVSQRVAVCENALFEHSFHNAGAAQLTRSEIAEPPGQVVYICVKVGCAVIGITLEVLTITPTRSGDVAVCGAWNHVTWFAFN